MKTVSEIVMSILLAAFVASTTYSQEIDSAKPYLSNFRYVNVNNVLLHNGRLIFVLMDEKAFSEVNLKELFKLVSERFPEPDELHVAVFTSLEQYPTPEEEDYSKSLPSSEGKLKVDPSLEKYPIAIYLRNKANESFSYKTGGANGVEKTVILKGEGLLHQKKKR